MVRKKTNLGKSKAKIAKKAPISVENAEKEAVKADLTGNGAETFKIEVETPKNGFGLYASHVNPDDSPIVKSFWRQKAIAAEKELERLKGEED